MSTINLRQNTAEEGETTLGRPLTNAEIDTNFQNLNATKQEFKVVSVTTTPHTQDVLDTHHLYSGIAAAVDLLDPADHVGVTVHKNLLGSAVVLTPPTGTIDGAANYTLSALYDSVSIYSDGTNYFIQNGS